MSRDSFYILVIAVLFGVILLEPKHARQKAPSTPPAPETAAAPESPVPTTSAVPQEEACEHDPTFLALREECRAYSKSLAAPLIERAQVLEKRVTDTFTTVGNNWTLSGKARGKGSEREQIIAKIKSEVLAGCRK